jgi:hypothetical protein
MGLLTWEGSGRNFIKLETSLKPELATQQMVFYPIDFMIIHLMLKLTA